MPRTRSSPAPRSVRHLTHQPKRLARASKVEKPVVESTVELVEQPEDARQRLIRQHAEVRASRHSSSFGAIGIVAVVLTCAVIFVGWWFLPNPFAQEKQMPTSSTVVAPTASTAQGSAVAISPMAVTSSVIVPTSTERRLLIPLTVPTSTYR